MRWLIVAAAVGLATATGGRAQSISEEARGQLGLVYTCLAAEADNLGRQWHDDARSVAIAIEEKCNASFQGYARISAHTVDPDTVFAIVQDAKRDFLAKTIQLVVEANVRNRGH